MKQILGAIRRADEEFGLIRPGDRILIGVSGGKDSLVLVRGLSLYRRFAKKEFTLIAGMLGMGLAPVNTEAVAAYCEEADVPFIFRDTKIGPLIFEERKEANPCSLCSRLRRAKLNDWARELGCNKLALGHHSNDATETLLMNLIYEGRLGTFAPITWMDRSDMVQIRPMIYATEAQVISAANRLQAPVCKNPCPANGYTKREEVKNLIADLKALNPYIEKNLIHAVSSTDTYALWDNLKRRPEE